MSDAKKKVVEQEQRWTENATNQQKIPR